MKGILDICSSKFAYLVTVFSYFGRNVPRIDVLGRLSYQPVPI